jgi:hypothetical protein
MSKRSIPTRNSPIENKRDRVLGFEFLPLRKIRGGRPYQL